MDEIEKVLDAISILQDVQFAQLGDTESLERLKERETLPDFLKEWIEKVEEPDVEDEAEDEEEEEPVEKDEAKVEPVDGKPKAENFTDEFAFAEALLRWKKSQEAKDDPATPYRKPIPEMYPSQEAYQKALDAYNEMVKEIKDAIAPELGEAIKKTLAPQREQVQGLEPIPFEKMDEAFDESLDARQYFARLGVKM